MISVVSPREQSEIDPKILNASVLISTRLGPTDVKFCSGTLIPSDQPGGNLRVLTNHHCFAEVDEEGIATSELLPEACVDTKIYLGFFSGQTRSSTIVDCLPGSLRTSMDGDLSVFRLATQVPDQFQPMTLGSSNTNLAGRQALIVHYPDIKSAKVESPTGGPKLPVAQVTRDNCKVLGNFPIGHWQFDRSLPYSLRHTCDLTHGSSGSGLIDAATGQLIGVNWGGIKINEDGKTEAINVATGITFVNAFLNFNTAKIEQQAASALAASDLDAKKHQKTGGMLQTTGVTKKLGCGVIGVATDEGDKRLMALWMLPLALAFLGSVYRKGRRSEATGVSIALVFSLAALSGKSAAAVSEVVADGPSNQHQLAIDKPNWASAILLSNIFIAEYDSLVAYDQAAASVMKRERPLHTAEWLRAYVGWSYLKARGFAALEDSRLADQLASDPAARANARFIAEYKDGDPTVISAVGATFKGPDWVGRWHNLSDPFRETVPSVTVAEQRRQKLQQIGSISTVDKLAARDSETLALYVASQVAERRFAEALAVLVGLAERDDSFRLPYELVQRTYSWRQRGSGKVAIQGL